MHCPFRYLREFEVDNLRVTHLNIALQHLVDFTYPCLMASGPTCVDTFYDRCIGISPVGSFTDISIPRVTFK